MGAIMTRSLARAFVGFSALLALFAGATACSSDGTVATLEPADATALDALPPDAPDAPDATPLDAGSDALDTGTTDSGTTDTGTTDTGTTDSAAPDTGTTDADPSDTPLSDGGTFACGASTCGVGFQFCRIATTPGICPAPDADVCPAGCPGCPPLGRSCQVMPSKCWAKPSCACILVETCGSVGAGTCEEKDGGFTAGCLGA